MNLNIDLFRIKHNNIAPKQGRILISEPFSMDSFFKRSVVLITEYNEDGAIGFILNKSVELSINEVIEDFPKSNIRITIGGPVSTDTLHYIHSYPSIPNSIKVLKDVYWGGDFDVIKIMAETGELNEHNIRFFLGYSGWAPEQLNEEISNNYWLVSNLNSEIIINGNIYTIWKDSLQKLGQKYKIWSDFPENPTLN